MKRILSFLLILVLMLSFNACSKKDEYAEMLSNAEAYVTGGDYTNAIAGYQVAQKLKPEKEDAFLGEANVHILLEDYPSAEAAVEKALEISPNSANAWALKCKVDVFSNDVSAFEEDLAFAEVCKADLKALDIPAASMYASAGEYEKAIAYFEKVELSSLDEAQQKQYAQALLRTGNRETAEKLGFELNMRNAELDAAFESGNLTLVKSEFPTMRAEDFEIADEACVWFNCENPDEAYAELESELAEGTAPQWYSLSPSGNSGILDHVCYYEGKYHVMYPSSTRGVEDEYGNLEKIYYMTFSGYLGKEGVVYSPDGRYAAITSFIRVLEGTGGYYDPIIIDLSTGEMILTATYANRTNEENYGAPTTAVFSSDGRYFYYMIYGNTTGNHTALYRYDIQQDMTELCYSGPDRNYYPCLSETSCGDFLIMRDTVKIEEAQGITQISCDNGTWTGENVLFDLTGKYWATNCLLYSSNSGYAVVPGLSRALQSGDYFAYFAFQRIQPDDDFAGINQYYCISEEDNQIQTLTADDVTALVESMTNEDGSINSEDFSYRMISKVVLSPDGNYALLLVRGNESCLLYLLRLEDFTMKEIKGIELPLMITDRLNILSVIEWNTDTLIIYNGEEIAPYQFQLQ